MNKVVILSTFVMALFFASLVHAEDVRPGSLAIGVHGIGAEWNYGRPMLRWRPSDNWAFDFTPTLSTADAGGISDRETGLYGMNVGIVKQIRNVGGVSVGWRMELGYTYSTNSSSSISSSIYTSNYRSKFTDVGFGPDLEYFVPAVPGLSLGASAQIHYRYIIAKNTYNYALTSYNDSYHESMIDLMGELLTVRYYF